MTCEDPECTRVREELEVYRLRDLRLAKLRKVVNEILKGCRLAGKMTQLQRARDEVNSDDWEVLVLSSEFTCEECTWEQMPRLLVERCRPCRVARKEKRHAEGRSG